jgi:hypothetical protein
MLFKSVSHLNILNYTTFFNICQHINILFFNIFILLYGFIEKFCKKSEEIPEGTIPRLYHALFMVKEDWDAKSLQELAEDIASL